MTGKSLLLILATATLSCLHAQTDDDPILFKVEDIEVSVSEFKYIYEKNNREGADYTRESLDEYLDLYAKFKLKVKKARDLQIDTISSLNAELAGYRSQLAKSYLNDRQVIDKLTAELYERSQTDVRSRHILFKISKNASADQEQLILQQVYSTLEKIQNGETVEALAREISQDRSTQASGGDLGFISAPLPNGFYEMENALFSLEPGEVSGPVRTPLGFHIIQVIETRPARGKVEISHILARIKKDGTNRQAAESKINGIYANLQDGQNFEVLAKSVSEDTRTAKRGGYIGKVGINEYDPVFEEIAFSLDSSGAYSEPFQTRVGWHIVKLIGKVELGSYEEEKRRIEATLYGDDRLDIARASMIAQIRNESGFKADTSALKAFVGTLDSDFFTFRWVMPEVTGKLISFNDGTEYDMQDFVKYLHSNAKIRMQSISEVTPEERAMEMFEVYSDNACLGYEEQHLDEKYPDFAALMREYEEGILLFEVTKQNVWDVATRDTAGLKAFHEQHAADYMWPERAQVVTYSMQTKDLKVTQKGFKTSGEYSPEDWAEEMQKDAESASVETKLMDRAGVEAAGWQFKPGWRSNLFTDPNGVSNFTRIARIEEPRQKELREVRGYVIADYQDYLEEKWVRELTDEYEVLVNEKLFESLIGQR